ncbi:MAG: hypothetical protein LBM70_09535 [Victivallales bacterium]|jgi:hypothetical protein|nr:hypothetical protein [Victivallales bacterium]
MRNQLRLRNPCGTPSLGKRAFERVDAAKRRDAESFPGQKETPDCPVKLKTWGRIRRQDEKKDGLNDRLKFNW